MEVSRSMIHRHRLITSRMSGEELARPVSDLENGAVVRKAHRWFAIAAILALLAALPGCFVGNWFGGSLPSVAYVSGDNDSMQVWVADLNADEPVRISSRNVDSRFPRWSRDYKLLAWVSLDGGDPAQLMVYERETGDVVTLVSGVDPEQPPVWSPMGDEIAYVSVADGEPDLYMVELENGRETRLTFTTEREQLGDWSPDGEWIVFTEDGSDGLLLRNPNGVNRVPLTHGPDVDPAWSPKGDRIAFVRNSRDGGDVYVLRPTQSGDWAADTDELAVSERDDDERNPDWSGDGRRLVFVVNNEGQSDIYTVLVDGSDRKRLTHNLSDDLQPNWSHAGGKIVFVSYAYGNPEIVYMNGDGSEQRRVTINDQIDTQPDW